MEIRVSGHQVDTGDALKSHVTERMQLLADKYFSRAISAQATFGKGPHDHGFVCDIVAHVGGGVVLKGSGRGAEAHPAFESAADKIESQLRRHSRRLKDRHSQGNGSVSAIELDAGYTIFEVADEEEEAGDAAVVVAETRVDVPAASVSDAVMMLDLRNTNALLFRNTGTGVYNMIYRRDDGTIGWVEPSRN